MVFINFFIKPAYADPDVVAQNYASANSLGIQSCTKGYGLLAGDVNYGSTQIQGSLPYILNYRAPLRQNITAAQVFEQPEETTSGWTDNYQSHVITKSFSTTTTTYQNYGKQYHSTSGSYGLTTSNPATTASQYSLLYVQLPGESSDTVFREQNGSFTRLYSTDPIGALRTTAAENLSWASDLGEYSLSRSGSTLTVIKNGVSYAIASSTYAMAPVTSQTSNTNIFIGSDGYFYTTTSFWPENRRPSGAISNTALYISSTTTASMSLQRVTGIAFPNGRNLTMTYDSNVNLTQVSDNRNNVLKFEHNFSESTTQTIDESRAVTAVTLISGSLGDTQRATFGYTGYNTLYPRTGGADRVFTLSSSNSPVAGAYTYTSQMTQIGALPAYVRNYQPSFNVSNTPDSSYYYPVLTQVINSAGQVEQQWNITQNYQGSGSAGAYTYSTAQTTVTSYRPGASAAADAMKMTTVYDDMAKTITMNFSPDGSQVATTNITTTITSASDVTINVTGNPCLTSGGKPISSVHFDTVHNRILSTTDANGIQTAYTYDTVNRLTQITEAVGTSSQRQTTYTYTTLSDGTTPNKTPVPNTITAPELTVTNTLNARGQIVQQTKSYPQSGSQAQTWIYDYYEDSTKPNYGLLGHSVNPRGAQADDQSWYGYDNYGNISYVAPRVTNTSRATSYNNYNSAGQPASVSYPDGTSDQMTYDVGYRTTKTIHGNSTTSQATINTYNSIGQLTSSTDPDSQTTAYAYDAIGRLATTTYPNGNKKTNYYFQNNTISLTTQTLSNGSVFESHWQGIDSSGRINYTRSGGATNRLWTQISFDANNNVLSTTTAQGIVNKWTYDALNRVTSHTDGNGKVDTKAYDDANNNSDENAANSAGSKRYFKNQNILASEHNSDFGNKDHYHDLDNNEYEQHHIDRVCNAGNIDQIGRPQRNNCYSTSYSDPTIQVNDVYIYDQSAYGNLDKITANNSGRGVDTSYVYDFFHRVTGKTQVNHTPATWGYTPSSQTVGYTYSNASRLTHITYPSGNRVDYNYDNNGVLNNIQLNNQYVVSGVSFDGANRLRGWHWGSSGSASFNLNIDDSGTLNAVTNTDTNGNNMFSIVYGYDNDGRIVKQIVNNATSTYSYDNKSQLTSEDLLNGSSISYSYDDNGNRLSLRTTGNPGLGYTQADYRYTGNHLNLWTKNGGSAQPLGLTPQGELSTTYMGNGVYDDAGHRRGENGPNVGMYFDYNHKNERTFRGGNYIDRQYAYDEQSHLIGEYSPTGAMIVEYIWMGDRPIAAIYSGNRVYYIVTDHQNKPRRGLDAANNQNVVWSWDPDAFGVTQPTEAGLQLNLRFPGQYYDQQSGLYYNHNRYYNPELGRYMEPDPLGLEGGLNPYSYAGNNPVNNVDPSGLDWTNALNYAPINPLNNLAFNPIPADIYYGGGTQYYTNSALSCTPQIQRNFVSSDAITPSYPEFAAMGVVGGARAVATGVASLTRLTTTTVSKSAGQLGREGEAAVSSVYDIGSKTAININGRVRIPDGLNATTLSEVKNVGSLSFTRQLRDYASHAEANGLQFNLYTRPDTRLTGPLQQAIRSGKINRRDIP